MSRFLHQLFFSVNVTLLSLSLVFPVRAQVVPDGTTSTTVDVDGTINNGDRAGSNLFHSFSEFSVPTGGRAFFNNATDIVNIFSRVTGGNISQINGLLGAQGTANLFLINPAGIIFGEGASLDIGGSFLGSTADSIVFPDGEFSATNPDNPPLITINAPIGLQFRETAATITNRSRATVEGDLPGRIVDADVAGLRVNPGKTLALVGGDLRFEGGNLTANGGRIELGSVGINSFVSLNLTGDTLVLDYAGVQNFQDINFFTRTTSGNMGEDNILGTIVDASGDSGGGPIQVQGRKISFTSDVDSPALIFSNTVLEGQGQAITVNASESLELTGDFAAILTETDNAGLAGNIFIQTENLIMSDGAFISSFASFDDIGKAGDLNINASESVELIGRDIGGNNPTAIFADAEGGDGGNLRIETQQLSATDGAQISTSTFGRGQAGNIEIIADSIILSGFSESNTSDGNRSGIFVSTQPGSAGDAGELTINADSLTIENGARISANTRGPGQGSKVTLNLERLVVQTGGEIGAGSLVNNADNDRGDGGTLTIEANDSIEVIGAKNINGELEKSSIFTLAEGKGDAGALNISTNQLTVADGGEINASSTGTGAAGTLTINADNLNLDQGSLTATTAEGFGGNINLIVSENLDLRNNSIISAEATQNASGVNSADSGNINIVANFILGFPSEGLGSDIRTNAVAGRGGDISILTQGVLGFEVSSGTVGELNNINDIDASSETSVDGDITISSPDTNPLQGANRLPTNPVSANAIAYDSCSADGGKAQLIITGKGGITPEPTTILTADVLVPDGKPITVEREITPNSLLPEKTEQEQENPDYIPASLSPIKTDHGDIYPARGIVKTADGKIILTAYSNPETTNRTPEKQIGCS
ncbi:filamentous hemagglutinin family N-terminal domain [Xenococcus sp. PCC 7305]|uniref:two-partner secretion domain-containing protein n=1 Tax=Xenococcus sp. PCC 7305 TaxID=102125 RepID=UPI0002AD0095|nr:filamentous hemagglutinin N-terminal domain-containing protein [Xenococcus sp. PCC 7305]ELS04097.1 filamentous hemagglutinin family N-terminal domain [Xenococcus sp. PCC 7305]